MKTSKTTRFPGWHALAALLLALGITSSQAVMLKGTGDPTANTTAPTGALQNSGWQYQGQWGSFLGTPIAPQYFVAAKHVGGGVGGAFVFNGVTYVTTACWDAPDGSDLRIWKVDGVFPYWAPLYTANDELGKQFVVIGRGTQRGEEVIISVTETNYSTNTYSLKSLGLNPNSAKKLYPTATIKGQTMTLVTSTMTTNQALKGWKAGPGDRVMRWGENNVSGAGDFLVAFFDGDGNDNEAYLSSGDSSGAMFIQQNGGWSLAAINYGIEGPFSTTSKGTTFYAALMDESGLYCGGSLIPNDGQLRPARFYATRISTRLAWINSILKQ